MRLYEVLEEIGDEDDLAEQLQYEVANRVTAIYNDLKSVTNNFIDMPPSHYYKYVVSTGIKMFLLRQDAIKYIGKDSNTVNKINIVLQYIQSLK